MSYIEEIQKIIDQHDFVEDALPLIDVNKVIEEVMDSGEGYQADAYLEPGYNSPENGKIIFSDWNKFPQYVIELLELAGHVTEWYDEWMVTDNGNAVRTSPDSYHWTPSYLITEDGYVLTREDSAEEWIECLKCSDWCHPPHALPAWINPKEYGFESYGEEVYQSGLHRGMNDDPKEVLAEIFDKYTNPEVVFTCEQSQFYVEWKAWVKLEEEQGDEGQ